MQWIRDQYAAGIAAKRPVISFELFPPKTEEGERNLLDKALPDLASLKPDYVSVTYGAGGGTQDKTLRIVEQVQKRHQLTTLAHLTCVNATRQQIGGVLNQLRDLGVRNILALRGDPPGNASDFVKPEGGFEFACELVHFIRTQGDFCIGVAGFPEGHIACKAGRQADWDHLVYKVGCGGEFIVTQIFFDNRDFFTFRDYLVKRGVTVPIIPGIIPILSALQIQKFTTLCGASLPAPLLTELKKLEQDEEAAIRFGIEYASRQSEELLREGAPGLHFYALNKARSTREVLRNLGLRPTTP
ncbi:MAG: methylenetetrahydrofolate reductase [NAD(P)H] [Verrucomicrobiota bacterium]